MNKLNFSKYTYRDRVKTELQLTIKVYSDLHPVMEIHTFNDGVQRNLISLTGTIKVYYRGQTYNIPVSVYLPETYPYVAPIAYVKPTPTMQIKPSAHVDLQGRIFLPYLTEWSDNKSDLQGLLSIMQIEFSEACPVFSKPQNQPYPSATSSMPAYGGSSGYPSYPPTNQMGIGSGWGNVNTPYPMQPNPYISGASYQPMANCNSTVNSATVNDNVLLISLLSAAEDKVHRRYLEIFAQKTAELEVLENTNKDLKNGSEKLKNLVSDMEKDMWTVKKMQTQVIEMNDELEDLLTKYDKEENVGIKYDDAVEGSAPLYRQLISLYIEEQSLEDALYFIGEAMGKEVIDMDTFLKKVRELSRRQFMLRATIKKCREKAGLPDV